MIDDGRFLALTLLASLSITACGQEKVSSEQDDGASTETTATISDTSIEAEAEKEKEAKNSKQRTK